MVEEGSPALENRDGLEESSVFDVILIFFILSMRQKLHHVKINGTRNAFILPNNTSHFEYFGLIFSVHVLAPVLGFQIGLDRLLMKRLDALEHLEVARDHQEDVRARVTLLIQKLIPLESVSLQVVSKFGQGGTRPGGEERDGLQEFNPCVMMILDVFEFAFIHLLVYDGEEAVFEALYRGGARFLMDQCEVTKMRPLPQYSHLLELLRWLGVILVNLL